MQMLSFKTIGTWIAVLISAAVLLMTARSLQQLNQRSREAGLRTTLAAIERAAVQCYALEGSYPAGLGYLQEHYGLQIDYDRYYIYYEVIASNLQPIIVVEFLEEQSYD